MATPNYINWIKGLPCLLCDMPSEPHHVVLRGHGSMGKKTSDTRAVPLCHKHHMDYHNHGRDTFAEKNDVDLEKWILRLNMIYALIPNPKEERGERCKEDTESRKTGVKYVEIT